MQNPTFKMNIATKWSTACCWHSTPVGLNQKLVPEMTRTRNNPANIQSIQDSCRIPSLKTAWNNSFATIWIPITTSTGGNRGHSRTWSTQLVGLHGTTFVTSRALALVSVKRRRWVANNNKRRNVYKRRGMGLDVRSNRILRVGSWCKLEDFDYRMTVKRKMLITRC